RGEVDRDSISIQVKKTFSTFLALWLLCLFCGLVSAQTKPEPAERHRYKIDLELDIDHLSYSGTETVRWINHGEKPTSIIYFHLYPNLRSSDQPVPSNAAPNEPDEPRLDVT